VISTSGCIHRRLLCGVHTGKIGLGMRGLHKKPVPFPMPESRLEKSQLDRFSRVMKLTDVKEEKPHAPGAAGRYSDPQKASITTIINCCKEG